MISNMELLLDEAKANRTEHLRMVGIHHAKAVAIKDLMNSIEHFINEEEKENGSTV